MEHESFLHDTNFWVLFAFIIFVAVVWFKARDKLTGFLDARSSRIKAELDEAERLKLEAQDMLADIQKKHRDALQTSQKIIDNARQTAQRLQEESEQKLDESLKRREAQLLDRIARAEQAAVEEVRNQSADIAARAAEHLLADTLGKRGGKIVDESIAEIPERLN